MNPFTEVDLRVCSLWWRWIPRSVPRALSQVCTAATGVKTQFHRSCSSIFSEGGVLSSRRTLPLKFSTDELQTKPELWVIPWTNHQNSFDRGSSSMGSRRVEWNPSTIKHSFTFFHLANMCMLHFQSCREKKVLVEYCHPLEFSKSMVCNLQKRNSLFEEIKIQGPSTFLKVHTKIRIKREGKVQMLQLILVYQRSAGCWF